MTDRAVGSTVVKWVKKVGVIGFLFFLAKGLLWLLIPFLISLIVGGGSE